MKNSQQDSVETQVKQLEQRAIQAEATLFSKTAELQAVQKKLDGLEAQLARETKRLLANQEREIDEARKSLQESIGQQNYVLTDIVQTIADMQQTKRELEGDISQKEVLLATRKSELFDVQHQEETTRKRLAENKVAITALTDDKNQLELTVSKLHTEESDELRVLDELKTRKVGLEQRIKELESDFEAKTTEKEAQQALLDAKLLASRQELELHQQEDALVRDSLASWQKQLEERDQNLRVRERKVEEGEGKLIQNANLLQL